MEFPKPLSRYEHMAEEVMDAACSGWLTVIPAAVFSKGRELIAKAIADAEQRGAASQPRQDAVRPGQCGRLLVDGQTTCGRCVLPAHDGGMCQAGPGEGGADGREVRLLKIHADLCEELGTEEKGEHAPMLVALNDAYNLGAVSQPQGRLMAKTFEEAWAEKEDEGYSYGEDALEQVRFGWELAQLAAAECPQPRQDGADGREVWVTEAGGGPIAISFRSESAERECPDGCRVVRYVPAESRQQQASGWVPVAGERVAYGPNTSEHGKVVRVLTIAYVDWDEGHRGSHEVTVLRPLPPPPAEESKP